MIGIKIINVIRKEHPEFFDEALEEKILHEAKDALKYEMQIVEWIVNGYGAEKLNSDILKEFIKNRLNESLQQIGYKKIFEVDNEMLAKTTWFDEQVLGNNSTDFFHARPVEYSRKSKSFAEEDLF
jgi:ribonucleoside-diphosphate reductase beta chain